MGNLKKMAALLTAGALMFSQMPVMAAPESGTESAAAGSTAEEIREEVREEGQLTMDDLRSLNGGDVNVYTDNGLVTFVDGTCTESPVTDMEDAAAVVDSMRGLLGVDSESVFEPWRTLTDPAGNQYYVFQQMYMNTTVPGGAVKVVTDGAGGMTGLVSSLGTELPAGEEKDAGLTAEEVEQLVVDYGAEMEKRHLTVIDGFTDKVILPVTLKITLSNDEEESDHYVWVVYTDNPGTGMGNVPDLPYLAHYVTLGGGYLYSLPTILPGDEAGTAGFDASYVFEFMEPADYTGVVTLSNGTEKELSVTLMRDIRTGTYYLGNLERRIVVGDFHSFVYDGTIRLDSSMDNLEWDAVGLLAFDNLCKAWDYYKEIGWIGGDGEGTPILILNNFCDEEGKPVDNACYVGKYEGWQIFGISLVNDLSQCLDVLAHEFTHCVTQTLMTYNSYSNDYGAINEAISDIQGELCDMMENEDTEWLLGGQSLTPFRNMADPNEFDQPAYTWDLYYVPHVKIPTAVNDYGGVHNNSGILNYLSYLLHTESGMTLEESRDFWFAVECSMVPGTDYAQLRELLPWVLARMGMDDRLPVLLDSMEAVRLGENEMPEDLGEDRALMTMTLPDTEIFTDGNWALQIVSLDLEQLESVVDELKAVFENGDFDQLPPGLREILEEGEKIRESIEEKGLLSFAKDVLMKAATEALTGLIDGTLSDGEETEAERSILEDNEKLGEIMAWVRDKARRVLFRTIGSAGQDGQTVQMVCRPGHTVPLLIHMVVDEKTMLLSEGAIAVYLNGRWYDLGSVVENKFLESSGDGDIPADPELSVLSALFQDPDFDIWELLSKPEKVLDKLVVKIEAGKTVELAAEGLEEVGFVDDELLSAMFSMSSGVEKVDRRQMSRPVLPDPAAESAAEPAVESVAEAVEESVAEPVEESFAETGQMGQAA